MYFAIHKLQKEADKREKRKRQPSPTTESEGEDEEGEHAWPDSPDKASNHNEPSDHELLVGGINFTTGAVPKHNNMGFTPYFNKNCQELRVPIPLTIFNKKWKNVAIIHHAKKRSRLDNLSCHCNRYTGYPYPSEWTQTFSKWTINHREFYLTMRDVYKFHKFAKWIYKHKRNADEVQAKDGFMVALRYDIQIRANTFAHRVKNADGSQSVANISIMQPKVQQSCYTTARCFNKLEFGDINPYSKGKAREDWDPTTGSKRAKKPETNGTGKATQASENLTSGEGKAVATSTGTTITSNYKGTNFDPNYCKNWKN
jgi:hypothetical protein